MPTATTLTLNYPRPRPQRDVDKPYFQMLVPVISTAHISQQDCVELWDESILRSEDGNGFIITLEPSPPTDDLAQGTLDLLKAFYDLGYRYLRFDCEVGDELAGVPTFEW